MVIRAPPGAGTLLPHRSLSTRPRRSGLVSRHTPLWRYGAIRNNADCGAPAAIRLQRPTVRDGYEAGLQETTVSFQGPSVYTFSASSLIVSADSCQRSWVATHSPTYRTGGPRAPTSGGEDLLFVSRVHQARTGGVGAFQPLCLPLHPLSCHCANLERCSRVRRVHWAAPPFRKLILRVFVSGSIFFRMAQFRSTLLLPVSCGFAATRLCAV